MIKIIMLDVMLLTIIITRPNYQGKQMNHYNSWIEKQLGHLDNYNTKNLEGQ